MSTVQSSYMFEDLQPKIEITETPESHLLHVHIPDGFTRSEIGAKVEYDFERVRVFGERSTGSNKRNRFNINHQVPSYCDINNITGKFDGKIITITMPIIPGAKVPSKQEQEPTKEEASPPEPVVQETQPKDQETDDKEGIPPQSATEDNNAAEVKDQKDDQEDTSDNQDPKSTVDSKENDAHETSAPQDEQKITMPQKGQEEISQNVESKGEGDYETSTTPEATQESMPQKGQEEAAATKDTKLQTEENTAGLVDENMEKQRVEKEETKDHLKMDPAAESGKQPEKEIKEESKGSDARVESVTTKHIEKEKEKEMNGNIGDDAEKNSDIRSITESTRERIMDMAASTTKAVTSLAKRLNEEDKQNLIYAGAAVLVVGLGVYATYKYRSSHRP